MCTTSVHNTKQNSSDNLPSYLQTNIITQDVVYQLLKCPSNGTIHWINGGFRNFHIDISGSNVNTFYLVLASIRWKLSHFHKVQWLHAIICSWKGQQRKNSNINCTAKPEWKMKPVDRYHGDRAHMTVLAQHCQLLGVHYSDSSMPDILQYSRWIHVQFSNALHDTQLPVRSHQAKCTRCQDYSKLEPLKHDWKAGEITAESVCINKDHFTCQHSTVTISQA